MPVVANLINRTTQICHNKKALLHNIDQPRVHKGERSTTKIIMRKEMQRILLIEVNKDNRVVKLIVIQLTYGLPVSPIFNIMYGKIRADGKITVDVKDVV